MLKRIFISLSILLAATISALPTTSFASQGQTLASIGKFIDAPQPGLGGGDANGPGGYGTSTAPDNAAPDQGLDNPDDAATDPALGGVNPESDNPSDSHKDDSDSSPDDSTE
jgi:hypothetical protein